MRRPAQRAQGTGIVGRHLHSDSITASGNDSNVCISQSVLCIHTLSISAKFGVNASGISPYGVVRRLELESCPPCERAFTAWVKCDRVFSPIGHGQPSANCSSRRGISRWSNMTETSGSSSSVKAAVGWSADAPETCRGRRFAGRTPGG